MAENSGYIILGKIKNIDSMSLKKGVIPSGNQYENANYCYIFVGAVLALTYGWIGSSHGKFLFYFKTYHSTVFLLIGIPSCY